MKSLERSNNLAARAGRMSARHWKTATFCWLAFVAIATVLGGMAGTKQLGDAGHMNGDSARTQRIIDAAGFRRGLVRDRDRREPDANHASAAFKRTVGDAVAALSATRGAEDVRSPYAHGNEGQISKNGHAALIGLNLNGEAGEKYDGVARTLRAVARVQKAHPGFRVEEAGGASLDRALDETVGEDFRRAELSSIPLTIGILLVAFGALLAAFLPVLLAISAVAAATGLLAFASRLVPVDDATTSVMLLIGLAVGVDYSLFYLKREREERALGKSRQAALEAAAATSGRSVLISGLTVIVAMAGMFLAGNGSFVGIGLGTIIVVAIAVLGSLTVLPAVLSRLGDNVERGRIPGLRRLQRRDESRVWGGVLDRVLHRPLVATIVAAGLLLALAAPALGLHTAEAGSGDLPQRLAVVQTVKRIERAFPGAPAPAVVAVKAPNVTAPRVAAAIEQLQRRALASGAARKPIGVDLNPSKTVAVISIPLAGDGAGDSRSEHALATLRALVRATLAGPGITTAVGGEVAATTDFNSALNSHMPLVFAFVLGLAFLLILSRSARS